MNCFNIYKSSSSELPHHSAISKCRMHGFALTMIAGFSLCGWGANIYFQATALNATSISLIAFNEMGGLILISAGAFYLLKRSQKEEKPELVPKSDDVKLTHVELSSGMRVLFFGQEAKTKQHLEQLFADEDCSKGQTAIFVPKTINDEQYNLNTIIKLFYEQLEVPFDYLVGEHSYEDLRANCYGAELHNDPSYYMILGEKRLDASQMPEDEYPSLIEAVIYVALQYLDDRKNFGGMSMFFCRERIRDKTDKECRLAVGFSPDRGLCFGAFPVDQKNETIELRPARTILKTR